VARAVAAILDVAGPSGPRAWSSSKVIPLPSRRSTTRSWRTCD